MYHSKEVMQYAVRIMIELCKQHFSDEESLAGLNTDVSKWFTGKYKSLTPPQRYSLKLIKDKKNLLITAPTGSGKTLSAFIAIISDLVDEARKDALEEKVYCIYVSPLRALNNDIYRNLSVPLDEIYSMQGMKGFKKVGIGIRTGDTTQKDRQRMLAHPPNILITTPESLAILLNSERFSKSFKDLRYVVIDEMHELANNKRGVHLSLSLERLSEMIGHGFIRIGLGATLFPLEDAARFLVGYEGSKERDCCIVDANWDKKMEYVAMCPMQDIVNAPDSRIEDSVYRIINNIVKKNRTTLIFTNTRSGTERTVFSLYKKFKYEEGSIAAHHGSLSREARLGVEKMLKKGDYKCVVSSTSLELGIDIGTIDNVILLGSPKSVSRALQRFGRSGHNFNDVAKGEAIVLNRDDLVECAVMLDSAKKRHLDSFSTPKNCLDVLSQHIMGMSLNKVWDVDSAFDTVRNAYPFHTLDKIDFMRTLEYLAGKYVGLESRRVYGKIWYDEKEQKFGKRGKLARLIYYLNLGTIPDEVAVDVYTKDKWPVGSIEEDFLSRLKPGDIFVLGGKVYQFESARGMRCIVSRADGKSPTIPPWFSEQLPLTYELATDIGRFREAMDNGISIKGKAIPIGRKNIEISKDAGRMLESMPIDRNARISILNYFVEQKLSCGYIPNDRFILIEATANQSDDRNIYIFHSLFGRRINDTLSRVIAMIIGEYFNVDVALSISDNGFVVITDSDTKLSKKNLERVMDIASGADISHLIKKNIRRTEMLKRRFRHSAARSFMILKNYKGFKISVRKQQFNADALIKAVESIGEDFPVLKETYREILEDVMDIKRCKGLLNDIKNGEVKYKVISTDIPSPFSHMLITLGEADVVMMADRRKRLRELHALVMKQIGNNVRVREQDDA